jgi:hypothetical protein
MRPVELNSAEEVRCFLREILNKIGKNIANFQTHNLPFLTLKDRNYLIRKDDGLPVQLPLTDEGCRGTFTWCGSGQLVKPEVLAALDARKKNGKIYDRRHCIYAYLKKADMDITMFIDYCDRTINTWNKKFVCEIPA